MVSQINILQNQLENAEKQLMSGTPLPLDGPQNLNYLNELQLRAYKTNAGDEAHQIPR